MKNLKSAMMEKIQEVFFPCIGAKALLKDPSRLHIKVCKTHFTDIATAVYVCKHIYGLQYSDYQEKDKLVSSVIIFPNESFFNSFDAEKKLWILLKNIHDYDKNHFAWSGGDKTKNVYSKDFSMSIGGHSHFIPLLGPIADEPVRHFKYVALVFNPHFMFKNLKQKRLFDKWRNRIRKNTLRYFSEINPKLGDSGESFEAPQYALTKHDFFIGACPFTGKPGKILPYKKISCPFH